ncbi:cobalt-precorrin-6A reductase [Nisaea acidiphila]|uniref:Cobalt-precorrin-6A reductase n=1 Tax=Nisaea acidiphila TaxID=1862145 RepID=A0A9J7ALJ1_9PROT|nr:cobalt-precorrin-6A reductase [Nisaea acidiphila]UUX48344.1 cobalt-precorrin-6A reductase [Nisaea acidiphila]
MARLLVLGGTEIANRFVAAVREAHPELEVILSLAGRTRDPRLPDCETRSGGFGGVEGLSAYLKAEGITALVDATHPYAAQISANAAAAAKAASAPCLHLVRPEWVAGPDDVWHVAESNEAAARHLEVLSAAEPRKVFLSIGRQELAPYKALGNCSFVVRSVEPPEEGDLSSGAELILARGPFSEADEIAFLKDRRIDLIVSKNSGGTATYGKIAAARALGLPVVMVERPALPGGDVAGTVETAISWLSGIS